jgi:hypothetical protein
VPNFQKDGRRWTRGNYMKLAKEKERKQIFFFWEWEKLSSDFAC